MSTGEVDTQTPPGNSSSPDDTTSGSGSPNDSTGGPDETGGGPDNSTTSIDGGDDEGSESSDDGPSGDTGAPVGGVGDLFWLVDAETGSPKPLGSRHDGLETQICQAFADEALSFVDMPDAYGSKALRLEMQKGWPWGKSNPCKVNRRGLLMDRDSVKIEQGQTTWFGWAVYVPADWTMKGNGGVTSLNVHGIPGTPPQIRVILDDAQWKFQGRGDLDIDTKTWPLQTGAWHEIVMESSYDKSNNGYIKLWHKLRDESEWTQHVDFQGQTAQGSAEFPFHIRFGFDLPSNNWGDGHAERVLYYDEVRVGDEMSNFDEVAPGNNFVPPGS